MDARPHSENPFGLNLDFLYGRGYLWAEGQRVTDWVTLDRLRMEIPDLKFPFDVRGGLARFRNTRCQVRELSLRVSEVGLAELIRAAAQHIDGFRDVEVRFQDGVAVLGARLGAFGSDVFVTFRAALIRPEPARSDVVELSLYDYRTYGPTPVPARVVGHEFLKRLLATNLLEGAALDDAAKLRGDVVELRPLKLVLTHVFASHGWKLPNLADVALANVEVAPGEAVLRARSNADDAVPIQDSAATAGHARALAAHDSKAIFRAGDEALFSGRGAEALQVYQSYQSRYRGSPELSARLLDALLAEPTAANLAEAETVCREIEERDPASIVAAIGRVQLADRREKNVEAAYEALSELLADQGDSLDRVYCETILARRRMETDPERAANRLAVALRNEPRNRAGLETLRELYERTDRRADLEDVLKRLTGVASDGQTLVDTYLRLALHLMEHQAEHAEARVFLERALRTDPNRLDVLDALGQSWVRAGEPARAIKALGTAARAAAERGDVSVGSRLHHRVARLWLEDMGDAEQALLEVRRAIDLWEAGPGDDPLELARQLRLAAMLCERGRQHGEAIAYWTEAVAALQLAEVRSRGEERIDVRRTLAETHRDVAAAYRARGRHDVAANHERRLLEMDPTDVDAIEALESHYREFGAVVRFVKILEETIERVGSTPESLAMRLRLSDLYLELGRDAESVQALELARVIAPSSETAQLPTDSDWSDAEVVGSTEFDLEELTRERKPAAVLDGNETMAPWKRQLVEQSEIETAEVYREPGPTNEGREGPAGSPRSKATNRGPSGEEHEERAGSPRSEDREEAIDDSWDPILDVPPSIEMELPALGFGRADSETKPRLLNETAVISEAQDDLDVPDPDGDDPQKPGFRRLLGMRAPESPPRPPELDEFRKKFEETTRKPPPLPNLDDVDDDTALARILRKPRPTPVIAKTDDATLEAALDEARKTENPAKTAAALEALLGSEGLDSGRRIALTHELAELLYYDLEDNERALPWLLAVRELDPSGWGSKPAVLNAIEAIYEERGSVEGQIEILRAKMERAESADMADTYRLLIAQLEWETNQDGAKASRWLEPVLERDERHEGARRLLADIADGEERWAEAADHLRIALSVAGDGLDSVELERRLATLLLRRLAKPEDAAAHFRNVLRSAPSDAGAMNALRACHAAMGDWEAYAHSLEEELRVLLGRTLDPSVKGGAVDWLDEVEAGEVPQPLRLTASQILSDIARATEEHLDDPLRARLLWGKALGLWPEHVEALERRIDLDRKLEDDEALATDLEMYASMLLDARARFDALFEAARIVAETTDDADRARELLDHALSAAAELSAPPSEVEDAKETLRALEKR